jgi:hypothetical protein
MTEEEDPLVMKKTMVADRHLESRQEAEGIPHPTIAQR